jgi:HK97 family phage major capsid protein
MGRISRTDRAAGMTVEELRARVAELDAEYPDENFPDAARDEWNALNERIDELETRRERIRLLAENPLNRESGDGAAAHGGSSAYGRTRLRDKQGLTRSESVTDWLRAQRPADFQGAEGLSFDRMVRGLATGNWDGAQTEQRAISETPTTAGGHMVPTPLASMVIDKARNLSRVFEAGATTVPMTSQTLKYARLTGEATPAWRSEAGAVTDQAMVFDAVTLTAQSLAVLVKCSVELFEDAAPSDVISNSFAKQIALELDRVALRGSGTPPEPKGVLNQTGVTLTAHGTNGSVIGSPPAAGTMGWEFLVQAAGAVRAANFTPTAHILAPRTDQSLGLLRDTTNQYIPPPRYLDGIPRLTTNQVPINLTVGTSTDTSQVYTAQWDQLLVGIRTGFNIRFLQERFMDNMQYAFLASLRADIQLAQPSAFVVDTGVRG